MPSRAIADEDRADGYGLLRAVLADRGPRDCTQAGAAAERYLSGWDALVHPHKRVVPPRIPDRFSRRLTIGLATYDDYDGVYFTSNRYASAIPSWKGLWNSS